MSNSSEQSAASFSSFADVDITLTDSPPPFLKRQMEEEAKKADQDESGVDPREGFDDLKNVTPPASEATFDEEPMSNSRPQTPVDRDKVLVEDESVMDQPMSKESSRAANASRTDPEADLLSRKSSCASRQKGSSDQSSPKSSYSAAGSAAPKAEEEPMNMDKLPEINGKTSRSSVTSQKSTKSTQAQADENRSQKSVPLSRNSTRSNQKEENGKRNTHSSGSSKSRNGVPEGELEKAEIYDEVEKLPEIDTRIRSSGSQRSGKGAEEADRKSIKSGNSSRQSNRSVQLNTEENHIDNSMLKPGSESPTPGKPPKRITWSRQDQHIPRRSISEPDLTQDDMDEFGATNGHLSELDLSEPERQLLMGTTTSAILAEIDPDRAAFEAEWRPKVATVFHALDHDLEGSIDAKDVGNLLRGVGLNPTQADVEEFSAELPIQRGRVYVGDMMEHVLNAVEAGLYARPSVEDMINAFRMLDTGRTGYLTADQLREFMTGLGEPLSENEFEDMLSLALDKNGRINYRVYVKKHLCV